MKVVPSHILCPSCEGHLRPVALYCDSCELKLEGRFEQNEFAALSAEELHFLRIFIRAEGRIRDMENALGLSYPTIRNRISQLKEKLFGDPAPANADVAETSDVLQRLQAGEIKFDEAMQLLKGQAPTGDKK